MDIPRKRHPKPQFERAAWMNLNGTWILNDNGRSGQARGMFAPEAKLAGKITVPFARRADFPAWSTRTFCTASGTSANLRSHSGRLSPGPCCTSARPTTAQPST